MKYKKKDNITYKDHLQNTWFNREMVDEKEIYQFLERLKGFPLCIQTTMPAFFILDYKKRSYSLVSEGFRSISNHDPRDILEGGLDKFLSIYHKDDFKIFNSQVFTSNMKLLQKTPQKDHQSYVFSNSYRIYNKDKSISTVLQKSCFITSQESGNPLFSFGSMTDISQMGLSNNYLNHLIEHIYSDENGVQHKRTVESNQFYIFENEHLLSHQERNVLCYIVDGLSSKMIGGKLGISINTVNNHRQSILKKTNCKNMAGLILYALKNKLI